MQDWQQKHMQIIITKEQIHQAALTYSLEAEGLDRQILYSLVRSLRCEHQPLWIVDDELGQR